MLNHVLFQAPSIQSFFRNFQLARLLNVKHFSEQSLRGKGHSVFPNLDLGDSLLARCSICLLQLVPTSSPLPISQQLLSLEKQFLITASHQLASTQDCTFVSILL